ncbi:MAG: hypothetical protein PWR24_770 [Desulfonauticus sp.]|nr:hypothetical protein [Desulfonauticus sp.]
MHKTFKDKYKLDLILKLYAKSSLSELITYLISKGNVFFDVDKWSDFVKKYSYIVGTRLHGTIVALNSGICGFLICHDSRTSEVAKFAEIPVLKEREILNIFNYNQLKLLIKRREENVNKYLFRRKINVQVYTDFLEESGFLINRENILS